jgi:hypothetical protein
VQQKCGERRGAWAHPFFVALSSHRPRLFTSNRVTVTVTASFTLR